MCRSDNDLLGMPSGQVGMYYLLTAFQLEYREIYYEFPAVNIMGISCTNTPFTDSHPSKY